MSLLAAQEKQKCDYGVTCSSMPDGLKSSLSSVWSEECWKAQEDIYWCFIPWNIWRTAARWIIVAQDPAHAIQDTVRLLMKAINAGDWDLCKELARFLTSFDSLLLWPIQLTARHGKNVAPSFESCWLVWAVFYTASHQSSDVRIYASRTKPGECKCHIRVSQKRDSQDTSL